MRLSVLRLLLAALLGVGAAFLVACGERNTLIPAGDAERIKQNLDAADEAVADEKCERAQRAVERAQEHAAELPRKVDSKLRQNLNAGLANLAARAQVQCRPKTTTTETTPTETATTPPTTETPPTETTPTETAPPETTPPPPDGGNGDGNGDDTGGTGPGNGNGTGGIGPGD